MGATIVTEGDGYVPPGACRHIRWPLATPSQLPSMLPFHDRNWVSETLYVVLEASLAKDSL